VKIEMKGCLTMDMIKYGMGKFKGIPVYKVSWEQWHDTNIDTEFLEEIFVVQDEVYYHDVRIGYLNSSRQLEDFDEDEFEDLRVRYGKKKVNHYTTSNGKTYAEVPTETVKADVEALVDKDCRNWQIFADAEMAKLKAEIAKMEAELNAVG
jgi:hypothetical protein